jgi:hypothetical protein
MCGENSRFLGCKRKYISPPPQKNRLSTQIKAVDIGITYVF